MSRETGDFTPVEVTKIGQLEHLLSAEQDVREFRTFAGGEDHAIEYENPSYSPDVPEEPSHYTVVFDKALLRGMLKVKKALRYDIVVDEKRNYKDDRVRHVIDQEKRLIVDGMIEGYTRKPDPYVDDS